MKERFIYLQEKYFENDLTDVERKEFEKIINGNSKLKDEFNEQKKIKEVIYKMKLKNPANEFWDSYWLGIYNRIERGIAWIAISIGAVIFFVYVSIETVKYFVNDTQTPELVKFGIGILIFGILLLLYSVIREKFTSSKKDHYKEIQR